MTAAGIGGVALLGLATPAHASVLDREQKRCGSATVTVKLERDGNRNEVDVEVYSNRGGERWRMTVKDADGDVLRTMSRTTDSDGEFDIWRAIPGSITNVSVEVRGPSGQRCTLQLRG